MGFLDAVLGPVATAGPPASDDFWWGGTPDVVHSGVVITPETALRISTVYRCVAAVSADIASMPLILFQRDGINKSRAPDHPLYQVLHDQPNDWQTSYEWREMMMAHLLLRGNAYNLIQEGPLGFADQLIPLNPARMLVEQLPNRRIRYTYAWEDGQGEVFDQDEIFHIKGFSTDGIVGLSTVALASESFGLGKAAEEFGARFFSQDGTPGGVLTVKGTISPEAGKRLERSWAQARSGLSKSHRTAVLEGGTVWTQVGLSNEDAQFLGTRAFQVEEMARWFGVPLHRIGHTEKATSWGTGIEQFNLGYIAFTLIPWIRRWEQSIRKDLILERDRQMFFVEFLLAHLLQADITKRYNAYDKAIKGGWMNRNEARVLESLNTVPGLDGFLVPQNMAVIGRDGKVVPVNQPSMPDDDDDDPPEPVPIPGRDGSQATDMRTVLIVREMVAKTVRKENKASQRAAGRHDGDTAAFNKWADDWWGEHQQEVVANLHLPTVAVEQYINQAKALDPDQLEDTQEERIDQLAAMALGE